MRLCTPKCNTRGRSGKAKASNATRALESNAARMSLDREAGTRRARCGQEPGLQQFGLRHRGRFQAVLNVIPMRQACVPWKGRFQNGLGLNFVQSELRRDVSGSTHGLRQTETRHLAPRRQGKSHGEEEPQQVPVQGALCCASTHCCTSSERGLFRFHMAGTWTSGWMGAVFAQFSHGFAM